MPQNLIYALFCRFFLIYALPRHILSNNMDSEARSQVPTACSVVELLQPVSRTIKAEILGCSILWLPGWVKINQTKSGFISASLISISGSNHCWLKIAGIRLEKFLSTHKMQNCPSCKSSFIIELKITATFCVVPCHNL